MPNLTIDSSASTPIYRQIVEQIHYLIEAGQLSMGDRLPPARLLAEDLGINRNTVAKAYAMLRATNLIRTRGAAGTTVIGSSTPSAHDDQAAAKELARPPAGLTVVFVECNEERATAFAQELSGRLKIEVRPGLIDDLTEMAADPDLLITTFFHLAEVSRWARESGRRVETAAIVLAPHIQMLMQVAALPAQARVGVRYSTHHQAEQIRDWLAEAGSADVSIVPHSSAQIPDEIDVLIVPTEQPDLALGAKPGMQVIELGNVLDEGSVRMIAEMLADLPPPATPDAGTGAPAAIRRR